MTTQITKPAVFEFEAATTIRAITKNGEPWFVAMDVCKALQLTNPTMSLKSLDDDERSKFNLGRQGNVNIISESGLYTLILRCRDAVTPGTIPYRFRKWVTSEVLPAIRQTGKYHHRMPETLADLAGTAPATLPAAPSIDQNMMQAIMAAIQSQAKRYSYPTKQNFMENFHTPEGVRLLAQRSQLMELLQELHADGNNVDAPTAELVCMCNYITDVSRILEDIATHAAYIGNRAKE